MITPEQLAILESNLADAVSQIADLRNQVQTLRSELQTRDVMAELNAYVQNKQRESSPPSDVMTQTDWTHPDSQFTSPTTKSIEQEYSTDGKKADMLKLYQFLNPNSATVDSTSKALIRTIVGSVPTLMYPGLTEVEVLTGTPSMSSGQWVFPTTKLWAIVVGAGNNHNGPLFTAQKLVSAVAPDSTSAPHKLQYTEVTAYVVDPIQTPAAVDIISIEECD